MEKVTQRSKYKECMLLLIAGYLRESQETVNKIIPSTVIAIIKQFYPLYLVYSIGQHKYGNSGSVNQCDRYAFLSQLSYSFSSIHKIYCNDERIYFQSIFNNHTIYAAGKNNFGQLFGSFPGTEDDSDKEDDDDPDTFVALKTEDKDMLNVRLVSKGMRNDHSMFITTKNEIYACGSNKDNQCGYDYQDLYFLPLIPIKYTNCALLTETIVSIHCGREHTIFLTTNGKIWACGTNHHGQCGQSNDIQQQPTPKLIESYDDNYCMVKICCGATHNLCLDKMGNIYGFGENSDYQLGLTQTDIDENELNIEQFWKIRRLQWIPYFKENDIKINHIECGMHYSLCIDYDGVCYLFGNNQHEQLSGDLIINDDEEFEPIIFQQQHEELFKDTTITDARCGWLHTVLLTKDRDIITFGNNYYNQCSMSKNPETYCKEPHILDKQSELCLDPNGLDEIVGILAESYTTIIITQIKTTKTGI